MTASALSSPVFQAIRAQKKKRVLLLDTSATKRELRAETMRKLGVEADCAADIADGRAGGAAGCDALVVIRRQYEGGHRDKFCEYIRGASPPQKLAFLVGKPDYLADSPNA